MKKVLALVAIAGFLTFGISNQAIAQDGTPLKSIAFPDSDSIDAEGNIVYAEVEEPVAQPEPEAEEKEEKVNRATGERALAAVASSLYSEINTELQWLDSRITNVERRVDLLQSNVALLMKQYLDVELKDTFAFIGINLGGARAGDDWVRWGTLEYDWLVPKTEFFQKSGSIFLEAGYIDWQEEYSFPTLPGEPYKTIAEDKMVDVNAFTVESAMRMVAGTARSMGLKVSGKRPF